MEKAAVIDKHAQNVRLRLDAIIGGHFNNELWAEVLQVARARHVEVA